MLRENVENERRAIQHLDICLFTTKDGLQIHLLRRAQLLVDDDRFAVQAGHGGFDLGDLAGPQAGASVKVEDLEEGGREGGVDR